MKLPFPQSAAGRLADGPAWRARRPWPGFSVLATGLVLSAGWVAHAGDILRGGAPAGGRGTGRGHGSASAEADRVRANAGDALARTSKALLSVQKMQEAARELARTKNHLGLDPNHPGQMLPKVPNGLTVGGLEVAPGVGVDAKLWQGAQLPQQSAAGGRTVVKIQQLAPQAVLNWKTFNVGKETTVAFDQSKGGAQQGQWIAFNKIQDPSGVPSQILGQIKAGGQVYLINSNGIIFGGTSQVNLRTLVASSLPINDHLLRQGLLNNRDAQFLFSTLPVPGGSDGTPIFTPAAPLTPTGRPGDVVVQPGAQLRSVLSGDGNGGRILLAGPNVQNNGTISTPAGQTILAAGLQVAVAAHASDDPSLRGLDVWVGAVDNDAGTSTNSGLIEALTGSATLAGRSVNQLGIIESSTSVNLNGRIDLLASYGAIANPNYDNPGTGGSGGPPFLFQKTGTVSLGPTSSTRILPDYTSESAVPGMELPERSQVNMEGLAVHLRSGALVLAPNGRVNVRAGIWPYRDLDGTRTTLTLDGIPETGLASHYTAGGQRFLFTGGQIDLHPASTINVAGSVAVSVPLAHSILNVEFRGSEFADSPVQRDGLLRGIPLTLDLRRTGVSNGRFWMGTALGDATGLAGLIERNAAQLTAAGGDVTLQAGGSIALRAGSTIDVSGGYFEHAGGLVNTTRLLRDGRLVEIHNANPGERYDGVFTGRFIESHSRWGVSRTYAVPWMRGERYEQGSTQGASGGTLTLAAASMALDGHLLGRTIDPPRGRASAPEHSSLSIRFAAEKTFGDAGNLSFLPVSPTPPTVIFGKPGPHSVPSFVLAGDVSTTLPPARTPVVFLSPELLDEEGFGHLAVENTDGAIVVPVGVKLAAPALGSISLAGANVVIRGDLAAPGGALDFKAYTISPAATAAFPLAHVGGAPAPLPDPARGIFTLASGASLSAAGLIVDDRPGSTAPFSRPLAIAGGRITIESFSADLAAGSSIDVSGGVAVGATGRTAYGNGGSITIRTGKDPGFPAVTGGRLTLGSTLAAYSGRTGGALTLQASLIQIGGAPRFPDTLLLTPDFFRTGGFTSYALEAIGASSPQPFGAGAPAAYAPAIFIAPGTAIEPVAESWMAIPHLAGAPEAGLRPQLKQAGLRSPVSLSFTALGSDDSFTTDRLEIRGDIVMGEGARIATDPGAKVSFKGQTITLLGSVEAPGGAITLAGGSRFAVAPDDAVNAKAALPTVHVGPRAVLSTAGAAVYLPDAFGRRRGVLYPGGTISLSGNIVASTGSVFDVSGASAIFDVHPSALGGVGAPHVPVHSGLNSPLWKLSTVPVQFDSNGGTIDLQGSQMLFSDGTLLGHAGGPTALGGTLSIFSGRFYTEAAARTSADINLIVTQGGNTIAATNRNPRVGVAMRDAAGAILPGMGYFAADRFALGGFDSLDLGFKFVEGSPLSFGGNVQFSGPVSLTARGSLRVAAGGVIQADAPVDLTAAYIAIGQPFRAPAHPDDTHLPFTQSPAIPSALYHFAPTFGPGRLTVEAELIDIGTLSLQNIGRADFIANGGDIRGNGTLQIAGDLTLQAAQIYPTTLSTFNVFAYDHGGARGSVTIRAAGSRGAPLSAGGSLNIFASQITQGGVLRAPQGSITLGWDGTDFDPSTPALDAPPNLVAGATIAVATARQVTLTSRSTTSVAAWSGSGAGASELVLPFGLSPDGASWIDPRGVNVTINGLPEKRISIGGNSVTTAAGSIIDLRGGGDLYGFRWTPGTGGSVDLLGTASGAWGSGTEYQPGDLVTFGGQTWSARVRHTGQSPEPSLYWTQVAESYAIVPGFGPEFAPDAPFNTGPNARLLGGDPGYVSSTLKLGDRIHLEGVAGLPAGDYTLLPRRYALLPGALLVTPTANTPRGTYTTPEGATLVAGYRLNQFRQPQQAPAQRSQFEVAPFDVVRRRAAYDDFLGNTFFTEAAGRFDIGSMQRRPMDAGYLAFHGNAALGLDGRVLTSHARNARGAEIDISSFADIYITGGAGAAPGGASVALDAALLNSWGADSLLIGGLRRRTAEGTIIDVRTSNLVLDNPGALLAAPEVTLASKVLLTVTDGSAVASRGRLREDAGRFIVSGDGALLRVSADAGATFLRSNVTAATAPLMTIGAGASIAGPSVLLDSTYGTALSPDAQITAERLDLGSGQISMVLSPVGALAGSVVPQHLVLEGRLIEAVQQLASLTLRSYRTIDVYGAGAFGNAALGSLSFLAGGLRGFDQGAGTARFQAGDVVFSNPSNVAALAAPGVASGTFQVDARSIAFGENAFSVTGYQNLALNAAGGVLGEGAGSFTTPGDLAIAAPLITGARGSRHAITAGGALRLESGAGAASVAGGFGASITFTGASVAANTAITLPSGQLTLRATGAGQDVSVAGELNVAGVTRQFYDVTRYSDGGSITLTSDLGDVNLLGGSVVSVAAPAGGGNAGTVNVKAAHGVFDIDGATFLGNAGAGWRTGSFLLDAGSLPSFDDLTIALNTGGFFEQRNLRLRTGDVTISNPGGQANVARNFTVSADTGNILVTGTIDASGRTGGKIVLATGGSLTLAGGALLTVHASSFSSAGKGGEIRIEAGAAVNGVVNPAAVLDVQAGSVIDLGVDAFVAGDFLTPGSSAFSGQFTGTLHLRAPRLGHDVQVNALLGEINGASSVIVEGYRLYHQASGLLDNTLRATINTDAADFMNAGEAAMRAKLLAGNPDSAALGSALVIAPGVEIFRVGDLTLGTAVSGLNSEDWNLATFRYGEKLAPGILTLRATGDLVFNATLSDGFTAVAASAANGNSTMWLAPLAPIVTANGLPVNAQSWSYRLSAGADLSAADFRAVLPEGALAPGKGSLLVGEFYPAIPNSTTSGANAAAGSSGTTENTIQITTGAANRTRFEVIRTGTGDIEVAAGRDVQLRNQFATIYTAGVRIPDATRVYAAGDFVLPVVQKPTTTHPNQQDLGAPQQNYPAQWAMAGGSVTIGAQGDIGRFTLSGADVVPDSSRQLPNNWLYRRGYVDPATGLFGEGGVGVPGSNSGSNVSDASASTAWWIDYSNFFQGFGALGGGNVSLLAGSDIINADAVIPTNARMPGRDALGGVNLAPDASKLLELGGGDLLVRAGGDLEGGVYHVERGTGLLAAGGEITTNAARSPSLTYLGSSSAPPSVIQSVSPDVYDPLTWLPTTLFVGKSHFEVSARGDVLLGPVTNTFLLPQGVNNKFWYKTYFNTFSADAGATVASFGGSVTHRHAITLPDQTTPQPILSAWLSSGNLFTNSASRASYFQPWIRLAETDTVLFNTQLAVAAPRLQSTAFAGDIHVVGSVTLFPSATGTIELSAAGGIIGLQPSGRAHSEGRDVTVWTSGTINLSDADPAAAPSIATPLAYANFAGRVIDDLRQSNIDPFSATDLLYQETGAYTGQAGSIIIQKSLHAGSLLHAGDPNPVRIYAGSGDVTGFTLFSPKATQVFAGNDISDIAFYLQNVDAGDISIVSAGRDIFPNNPNAPLRALAGDTARGNIVGDVLRATVTGVGTAALPGDLQINGPGVLEVLAGRNIDLGTQANLADGTGVGITSIGNARNPALPFDGADLIAFAGVRGPGGSGPALGLGVSTLDFTGFSTALPAGGMGDSDYLRKIGAASFGKLSEEQQAIVALERYFGTLREAGRSFATTGDYAAGLDAAASLFHAATTGGEIFTRARDIRTSAGGAISLAAAGGGVTMASDLFGNPLTPPGIVTEYGGSISIFTDGSVDIGQARIFTLRGGDITIWSTAGDIAAGSAPKTVVTAPPTRVIIDATSADVKTDLGGLATGGGIGVLASVAGVTPGDVDLIAPQGVVDAGDAGIRSTGNLNIAATAVLNASNIQVGGSSTGVPSAPQVAAPNLGALGAASAAQGAQSSAAAAVAQQQTEQAPPEESPSIITVEVLGYGGGEE